VKVVVTGGAGFIGANLCRLLASTDGISEIVVFDDLSTGFRENLEGCARTSLVVGDIRDMPALKEVVADAASVVHLAARPSVPLSLADPRASHEVNVTGTLNVLECARESGAHVVVASSSAVYGESAASPKHEGLAQEPISPYGVTKVATEGYAAAYQNSFAVPTLALRFFNVYGPLQPAGHAYAAVVPAFVSAALTGKPLPLFGDGRQMRDFVFVGTVADVLARSVLDRITSETPVNLASGAPVDLLTLVAELAAVLGFDVEIEHFPARVGDIRDSQADQTRFQRLFPSVSPVELSEGLRETVAWWKSL
jgi:UDP-glucose 4-epimerase